MMRAVAPAVVFYSKLAVSLRGFGGWSCAAGVKDLIPIVVLPQLALQRFEVLCRTAAVVWCQISTL
jgi:hypothetical protein